MIVGKRFHFPTNLKFYDVVRFSATANPMGDVFGTKFTLEEHEKILNTLNSSDAEELSRFDVTQTRIKNLVKWKSKEGYFKSLTDVLEVDGLSLKVLERLCRSIVMEMPISKTSGSTKSRRQFLIPKLNNEESLESAVGFHIRSTGISCAKLCQDGNRLDSWYYSDFTANNLKKMQPLDTFKLAMRIVSEVPTGNAYIFEASTNMSLQSNKQASIITSYNQQLELTSMLFTLINTSAKHNCYLNSDIDSSNCVYHLRPNASARLFKTLMGTERVSAATAVTNILQNNIEELPCTSVNINKSLQEVYNSRSPVIRELLGQSLLLIVTFMELCVYKNPKSLLTVMPSKTQVLN